MSASTSARTRPRARRPGPPAWSSRASDSVTTRRGRPATEAPPARVSGRELLMRRDEVVQVRVARRLGAVGDAELAVRVRQVELRRLLGHPERAGDLAVRVALRRQAQDLQLAGR